MMIIAILASLIIVASMPYNVPLQGIQGGKKTLVLLDDLGKIQTFSIFFDELKSRGHILSFYQPESPELKLKVFGESLYDNIVFFAPTSDRFSSISFEDIVEFSNEGGNILFAVNREVSDSVRDLVETFGFSLDKKGTEVLDHFNGVLSVDTSLQHSYVLSKNAVLSSSILGSYVTEIDSVAPVLFHGIGHSLDDKSVLAVKVLTGSASTYSASANKPIGDFPESAGQHTLLVSAIQARNNARVVLSGSLDLFSNELFRASLGPDDALPGNELFCKELSKWGFGERGVLRFSGITHFKSDGSPPDVILHEKERPDLPLTLFPDPEITRNSLVYRIKDEIVYTMYVQEFVDGEWKPFCADDMQMEFVMMDPYVRRTMSCRDGRFTAAFVAPDSYGVFKFRVLYRRLGYSVLHAETQVSIRPFKHDEYERFILSAYPYYSSAISAAVAFFVFSLCFFFSSDSK